MTTLVSMSGARHAPSVRAGRPAGSTAPIEYQLVYRVCLAGCLAAAALDALPHPARLRGMGERARSRAAAMAEAAMPVSYLG
jgi:hypothetical protein